jgi:POT family proton-dependent oligopeptide transporter
MTMTSLKQPTALYNLFFIELWERFGFYCVQSLLVLFLSKAYHLADAVAYDVFTGFSALIYASPVIGGYIADKFLGFRKAILLGAILYIAGYFALATTNRTLFYPALALLVCGNGFFKSCVSSLVGSLYEHNDPRRDSGFTIFYMGINIGGFFSPILCTWAAVTFGWGYGFLLAGIGMLFGFAIAVQGFKRLGEHGLPPDNLRLAQPLFSGLSIENSLYLATIITVFVLARFMHYPRVIDYVFDVFAVLTFIGLTIITCRYSREQRNKMFLLLVLTTFSVLFWALYNQTFSSITLYTDRIVDRHIFHWIIPTAMFQAVNPFFIVLLSPMLAKLWARTNGTRWGISMPMKFAIALLLMGAGFLALSAGVTLANKQGMVSMFWLNFSYFLQTAGELCLSPIGLSMITALAPANLTGMLMGVWFLAIATGYAVGDYIANLTSIPSTITDLATMGHIYSHTYTQFGWVSLSIGLLLVFLTPILRQMIAEKS